MGDLNGFLERCEEVREAAESMSSPLIVNHYDADGIASGALIRRALALRGIQARNWTVKRLSQEEIALLKREKELIFADLGGGQLDLVETLDAKIVIIDHHQTRDSSMLQVNPHLFGYDGGSELSSSGCGYFVFRNPELVQLGVVGAVGDMQFPLHGLNRIMLEEGMKNGIVVASRDLAIFGRMSRPLLWFLQYCTEPFLPGLTGKKANCALFLEELGIPLKEGEEWRRYYQLSHDEKVRLVSGLVAYLYAKGADAQTVESLVGEVYSFPKEQIGTEFSDANEYATVLNACGRHGKPEVGLGVCLKEESALKQSSELLVLHRRQLREAVQFACEAVEDFGVFHFLDARNVIDDTIVGVVAGMLYGSAIKRTKPILAFALNEEKKVKVSGRATRRLVDDGLNLGTVMKKASEGIGAGGGHDIAAGAQLEKGVDEFLLRCGEIIQSQLASSA